MVSDMRPIIVPLEDPLLRVGRMQVLVYFSISLKIK